ncbi:MAG: dihydrofolate reductase, partial [Oscillospiraceae bacterium]
EKSANVDIAYARERSIKGLGIRDYGDQGVAEYVTTELIDLLHGFENHQWRKGEIHEITGIKIGIVGLGTTGSLVAQTLQMFG